MRILRFVLPAATMLITAAFLAVPALPATAADGAGTGNGNGASVRYLVRYAPGTDVPAEAARLKSQGIGVGRSFSHALRGAVVTATPAQAAALSRSAGVTSVEVDAPVTVSEIQQALPWGLDRSDQRALPLSGSYSWTASGAGVSAYVDSALQAVINDGVTAVVAAGNSATDACGSSPARLAAAVTVAASDTADRQASFSNYGSCVDLYAPGVGITSATYTSNTATASMSGTSMASPHTAGAGAVLLSQNPGLTPAQVASALASNATAGVITGAGAGTPNRLLYTAAAAAAPAPVPPAPAPAPVAPAPTVTAKTPAAGSTAVPPGSDVTATFSAAVQGVSAGTFVLRSAAGTVIPATVIYNATTKSATLDPSANLATDGKFTATLTGGATAIRDAAGTPLAGTSWTFVTGPAPVITSYTPGSNALLVRRSNNITVTFNEAVQGVSAATFTVKNAATGAVVPAAVVRNGTSNQWILDPQLALSGKTKYTVTVTGGGSSIRDLAGNQLATKSLQFTTGSL